MRIIDMIWKKIGFIFIVIIIIISLSLVYFNGPRSIYFGKGWNLVYSFYPPLLRVLEKIGIHSGRQDFLIGKIDPTRTGELEWYLAKNGFEYTILSWKDTDEILNMRKIDEKKYQYHLRIYIDGEVRSHYEYSSEGNPLGHIFSIHLVDKREFFLELLKDYLLISYSKSL